MNKILNALQFACVRKGSSSGPRSVSPDDVAAEEQRRTREREGLGLQ